MAIWTEALRLVLLLLLNCKGNASYGVVCTGELTVDQNIIPIGSNLTVHCRSNTVKCGRIFVIKVGEKEVLRQTSCSSVTAQVVVNEPKFMLYCIAEQDGEFRLVCGRDITANPIPSPPHITEIAFAKGSLSPTIHWHSLDNMENLKPVLRFKRSGVSDWMEGNLTQLHRGTFVMLGTLEPLTSYQFELRVCTASARYNCSLWSRSIIQRSPAKAPSTRLDVWRIIMRNEQSDTQNVTVMWKPLGTEDYQGVLHRYEIVYKEKDTTHTLNCSMADTQYTLQLPLEVTEVNVSAVTSAGSSPPASVRLNCSADMPTPNIYSSHAAEGGINLAWDSPPVSDRTSERMLGFVVQWQCTLLQVQWKRIEKNYNSVYIHATQPTLCNISLYVESSERVSCPSFNQIYRKNDSDTVFRKRNFVTDVEILKLQQPSNAEQTTNGQVVLICLMTAAPIFIIVHLMYLKCTRQRIRKACMSLGPAWLFQNLPKLGNSNAIKLLKDERYGPDLRWQPVDNDPPLSPVEDYSPPVERKDSYPIVNKEVTTEERMIAQDWTTCPYKPQIMISQEAEAASEVAERDEDEPPWVVFSPCVFNTFDQRFFPSHAMHAPLPNCLTVDGRPVSMDLVDGFPLFTPIALDGNMWTDGRFGDTGNVDENQHQRQTVSPFSNNGPTFPVQRSLHTLQVEEQLL